MGGEGVVVSRGLRPHHLSDLAVTCCRSSLNLPPEIVLPASMIRMSNSGNEIKIWNQFTTSFHIS